MHARKVLKPTVDELNRFVQHLQNLVTDGFLDITNSADIGKANQQWRDQCEALKRTCLRLQDDKSFLEEQIASLNEQAQKSGSPGERREYERQVQSEIKRPRRFYSIFSNIAIFI